MSTGLACQLSVRDGRLDPVATALEIAVSALSDPDVAVPDALRRLLVVSRRIGADDLTDWLRGELNGYPADVEVPTYRKGDRLPVKLQFDGPMGMSATRFVSPSELPDQLAGVGKAADLREPVAELEALTAGNVDPQLTLPMAWISRYRRLAEEGKTPRIEMMVLNHAGIAIPRTHLNGILDRVKSNALDLALSFEDISPEVGDAGGPTVADDPRLAQQVDIHLTQLFATGSTITIGDHATVASGDGATAIRVEAGDVAGMLRAATAYLDSDGVEALAEALGIDGGKPDEATKSFLDRVKTGSYVLAGGLTTNAAYDGIVALLRQTFPDIFS